MAKIIRWLKKLGVSKPVKIDRSTISPNAGFIHMEIEISPVKRDQKPVMLNSAE